MSTNALQRASGSTFVARIGLAVGAVGAVCTLAHGELERLIGGVHDPICGVAVVLGTVLAYLGKSDFDRRGARVPTEPEGPTP
jgi:hypothetical protein